MDDKGATDAEALATALAQVDRLRRAYHHAMEALWRLTDERCGECELDAPAHMEGCRVEWVMREWEVVKDDLAT